MVYPDSPPVPKHLWCTHCTYVRSASDRVLAILVEIQGMLPATLQSIIHANAFAIYSTRLYLCLQCTCKKCLSESLELGINHDVVAGKVPVILAQRSIKLVPRFLHVGIRIRFRVAAHELDASQARLSLCMKVCMLIGYSVPLSDACRCKCTHTAFMPSASGKQTGPR